MRCLFLITDLQIGGTPRVVYELATRLRNDNVETAVACLAPWGPVADELCRAGVAVTALGATQPWQLPAVVRSVTELASESDVVFSFLMHANVAAALAARRTSGVRWIQSIQTTQPKPRWHWPLQGWAAKAAQHIVVPSKSVAEWAAKRSKIPADQFVVIPNAVDVDAYASLPRPPLNVIHRVGFIGRLDPVKRLPDLLRAVAALSSTHLSIFGDGPERLRLVRMIEQLKLQSRVTLHGTIPSAKAALPLIDTLVLPSDAEGFGLVLIEAMAAGAAVVGTDVPGIRDVIRHGETGLLVPPRSPKALAAAIEASRLDTTARQRRIANAQADVRQRFTWPPVLAAYRQVLGL